MQTSKCLKLYFFLTVVFNLLVLFSFSQNDKQDMKSAMLTYVSDSACNCIKKINTAGKPYSIINDEINDCILNQVSFYRLTRILIEKDSFLLYMNDSTLPISQYTQLDAKSDEFLNYYFEIKSQLLENCLSMMAKVYSNDEVHQNSLSSNKKAMKLYNEAVELEKGNLSEKSIELLLKSIKKDSNFAFAWDILGLNYRKTGEYDKAIDAYEHSITIDPKGKLPWQNMAVVYEYKKDYMGAIICYKKLAKLDIINPEVFYGIGRIYALYLNDYEYALENMCIAFSLYKEINSPDVEDAKTFINVIHEDMKKDGNEEKFEAILLKHFPNEK